MRLITQRSQVQILPPLQVRQQARGPFSLRGGRASCVRDRTVTANAATGCGWMWVDSGVLGGHLRRYGAGCLSLPSTARRRWPRRRPRDAVVSPTTLREQLWQWMVNHTVTWTHRPDGLVVYGSAARGDGTRPHRSGVNQTFSSPDLVVRCHGRTFADGLACLPSSQRPSTTGNAAGLSGWCRGPAGVTGSADPPRRQRFIMLPGSSSEPSSGKDRAASSTDSSSARISSTSSSATGVSSMLSLIAIPFASMTRGRRMAADRCSDTRTVWTVTGGAVRADQAGPAR